MDNVSSYCVCNGEKPIGIIGAPASGLTNNVFVYVSDNYLHIFDEKFPGFRGTIEIKYCPICGKKLTKNIMPAYDPEAASQRSSVRYA